jgi:hypothetical protein
MPSSTHALQREHHVMVGIRGRGAPSAPKAFGPGPKPQCSTPGAMNSDRNHGLPRATQRFAGARVESMTPAADEPSNQPWYCSSFWSAPERAQCLRIGRVEEADFRVPARGRASGRK